MEENETPKTNNTLPNTSEPLPVINEEIINAASYEPKPEVNESIPSTAQLQPINITVNVPKTDGRAINNANIISIAGVLVNIVLIFFTYKLLKEATQQSNTAKKSAQAAINAVNEAKVANDLAGQNSTEQGKIASKTLALTEKSVNGQLGTLSETQRQFEIANKPFLQLDNFSINRLDDNRISIDFDMINLGAYPIQVIGNRNLFKFSTQSEKTALKEIQDYFNNGKDPSKENHTFIVRGEPSRETFATDGPLPKESWDVIDKMKTTLYFCEEVTYFDQNNKKHKMRCAIRINFDNTFKRLINETIDIH